nr:MAG TPA: hypothetical protein [Caudoviricetes sp.]
MTNAKHIRVKRIILFTLIFYMSSQNLLLNR